MKCSRCNNEATTHLHQNINGQVTETWLCSECAEQMGIGGIFSGFGGFGDFGGLSSFGGFESLLGSFLGGSAPTRALPKQTRCSVCGSTFNDIVQRGKVGCADCYELFAGQLKPTIERIHGRVTHAGKLPGKSAPQVQYQTGEAAKTASGIPKKPVDTVEALKTQLKKAVTDEEYEKAAQLRDRIREMEGQK